MATEMKRVPSPDGYERKVYPPETPTAARVSTEEAGGPPPRTKIAVFAAHGMGQQIPFQTMDDIASGLLKVAKVADPKRKAEIRTSTVKLQSGSLQRIELDVDDVHGQPAEIHVYEGYWAPLTEGKLSARDVITFLRSGIWNGILKAGDPFRRWLFGGMKEPARTPGTTWWLVVFLLFLLSLLLFNAVIGAVALGRYVKLSMGHASQWPSDTLLPAITTVISWFCIAAAVYGLVLFLTMRAKRTLNPGKNKAWVTWNGVLWLLFFVLVFLTIAAAVAITALIVWERVSPAGFKDEVGLWPTVDSKWWPIIWVGLFAITMIVRRFVIEYVGDVAAYVASHKLDRFFEIRQKIRQCVEDVATAVYSAKKSESDSSPLYERIGIIGHSLGSVVVYDVLNRLLNEDELNSRKLKVADRTTALVTFGSPLDKVAYLFALQGHKTTDTREALAASVQPLIQNYQLFRSKLKWVNVRAPHDIFAGKLDFYDDTSDSNYQKGMEVQDEVDENAVLPLVAHTEYWTGTKIYSELYNRL